MSEKDRFVRPVVTRSRIVLEMGEYLADSNEWPYQQAKISLRPQGGGTPGVTLFGSDSHEAIDLVARGEVQLAIVNPAAPLALAVRGAGPFREPIPLRAIAVIPSGDSFAFAVSQQSGITSMADIPARKYPLKVTVRGQRDHANHFLEREVMRAYGFSYEDIISWGGEVRFDPGLPDGTSTSGGNMTSTRLDMVRAGTVDAMFDEAVLRWINPVVDAGFRVLSLDEEVVQRLEAMGFRRSVLRRTEFTSLPADVLTLDFSGWPIYTHANVPDDVVRWFCESLVARRDRMPWQGDGPLPLERMVKDSPEGPLDIPLHPAAERFWRNLGYL